MKNSKKEAIDQKFNHQERALLQSKMWWVADNQNPFLIKFAVLQKNALIMCTNLKQLWVRKVTSQDIENDKYIYAKGLNIKDIKNLLNLFQDICSKNDSEAAYKFTQNQDDSIDFKIQKKLTVYSLVWKFKLDKIKANMVDITCKQILNPLSSALQVQNQRIQIFRKKMQAIEKDYIRKMTEAERRLYKSALIQTEQEWKMYIPKIKQNELLNNFKFDKCSQFIIKQITTEKQQKKEEPKLQLVNQNGKKSIKIKNIPKTTNQRKEEDDDMDFEAKLDRKKTKKPIRDFI